MSPSPGAGALVLLLRLLDRLGEPGPQLRSLADELGLDGIDPRLGPLNAAGAPSDPSIAHAALVADPRSGVVVEASLWPLADPEAPLTPAVLRAALGAESRVPRALGGRPDLHVHQVERRGLRLELQATERADGSVERVSIRR